MLAWPSGSWLPWVKLPAAISAAASSHSHVHIPKAESAGEIRGFATMLAARPTTAPRRRTYLRRISKFQVRVLGGSLRKYLQMVGKRGSPQLQLSQRLKRNDVRIHSHHPVLLAAFAPQDARDGAQCRWLVVNGKTY